MSGETVGHYRILEKLGQGRMGVVYKAHDTDLDRDVALKFLPNRLTADETEHARFLQEARAAALLNHPNICTVHAIEKQQDAKGTDEQFIVMEYVDGKTLREMIAAGQLRADNCISYAVQIGEALQEAHSKGIVHRDIKPDNIMVNSNNRIKVMDFGLAKLKGSLRLTRTSHTVGTLAYMAPEQIQGGNGDARSDIFSFGVLLYVMLTRQMPFRGEHEAAMMYSIVNEEPTPIQRYLPEVPSELLHILNRALEKDPEERYQNVHEMVIDLKRLGREMVRSSRVSAETKAALELGGPAGKRSDRTARKGIRRYALIGSALSIVLIAAGLSYFLSGSKPINSIAVLPFVNATGDPRTEYLSDGISEGLINSLSQLSNLTVMSRSSAFHYKGEKIDPQTAGKELGVKAVLTGRVTQRGDDLDISTELVDVARNSQIWGEQYHRRMSDLIGLQEELSKDISEKLSLRLVGEDFKKLTKRATENPEAYRLYLQGLFYWNKRTGDDLQKAAEYFTRAVQLEPNFAQGHAALASAIVLLPEYARVAPKVCYDKAENEAKAALRIDPTLAEAHAVLGLVKTEYEWDWAGAEREFQRAIELNPNYPTTHHWYAILFRVQGQLRAALSEFKRARELDPLSTIISYNIAAILYDMRDYDNAIVQLKRTLEIDNDFVSAYDLTGLIYAAQGRFGEAITSLQTAAKMLPEGAPDVKYSLGYCLARMGRKKEALSVLHDLLKRSKDGYSVSSDVALVYEGLGDTDKAFEWLQIASDERNPTFVLTLKCDPRWDALRSDPRFPALLKNMGLAE